jgi:Trk K+ transport system NAD-binding subunit
MPITKREVAIFGYGSYARSIAKNVKKTDAKLVIFVVDADLYQRALHDGYEVYKVDLNTEVENISNICDIDNLLVFCAMNNDANNIFATISLRAVYQELPIIAIGSTHETALKLKNAGASKVIEKLQTVANIITDMIEKPIVTELMRDILYDDSSLKIAQIYILEESKYIGKYLDELNTQGEHHIIVLGIVDKELSMDLSFTTKGSHHLITESDILVVIGYDEDITEFKEHIGGLRDEEDWNYWSREMGASPLFCPETE